MVVHNALALPTLSLPTNIWLQGIAVAQLGATLSSFSTPPTIAPYSKFAQNVPLSLKVPSRQGMLLIYTPAAITAAFLGANGLTLPALLLFLHFAKRVAETLFVHRYSGSTSFDIAAGIGVYYALVSALIIATSEAAPNPTLQYVASEK